MVNFPCAQACIDHYASMANMHTTKQVFDLQAQWPVRRNRYWCHLLRQDLPCIDIPVWHPSPCFKPLETLCHLMQFGVILRSSSLNGIPVNLPSIWIQASALTPEPCKRTRKLLQFFTLLGPCEQACPCGCRAAFSMLRLRRGGARGVGLISARSGKHRHLHHEEEHSCARCLQLVDFPCHQELP